jgi:abortive infection bacteriophage resistance protein
VVADPKALKPYKTYPDQLAQLEGRGLTVADRSAALAALQRLGYYRLSGYFYALRKTNPVGKPGRQNDFETGASFELVVALADFDKRLRLLALDAIESVEIAVRVAIAYRLGKFDPARPPAARACSTAVSRSSAPVRRSPATRTGSPASRSSAASRGKSSCSTTARSMAVRCQSGRPSKSGTSGLLSRFFEGMASRDQNALAHQLRLGQGDVLESWLRSLNFVRNVAAHHSRLWNRRNPATLKLPSLDAARGLALLRSHPDSLSRVFGAFTALAWLLQVITPGSDWPARVRSLVASFPTTPLLSLEAAGFPEGWEQDPLWA